MRPTSQAQQPGPQDATIAAVTRWPASLQPTVEQSRCAATRCVTREAMPGDGVGRVTAWGEPLLAPLRGSAKHPPMFAPFKVLTIHSDVLRQTSEDSSAGVYSFTTQYAHRAVAFDAELSKVFDALGSVKMRLRKWKHGRGLIQPVGNIGRTDLAIRIGEGGVWGSLRPIALEEVLEAAVIDGSLCCVDHRKDPSRTGHDGQGCEFAVATKYSVGCLGQQRVICFGEFAHDDGDFNGLTHNVCHAGPTSATAKPARTRVGSTGEFGVGRRRWTRPRDGKDGAAPAAATAPRRVWTEWRG